MVRLEDIVIDPEFRDLLPSLQDRSRLEAKIELEGWSDEPITVWMPHCILLDGHNRYAIWQDRGDDGPAVREMKFATREAAFHWVVNNQCARRNLTPEEQRYLLHKKYTAEKKCPGGQEGNDNAEKRSGPLGQVVSGSSTNTTRAAVAKREGVGEKVVRNAHDWGKAVDVLDAKGVVSKNDFLSGKVKAPATRVIKAAELAETDPEEAKAVLTSKTRKQEDTPTSTATNTDAPRERDDKAFVAQVDAINFLQRSKLVRLAKNNPDRLWAFDEVIRWLKQQKANNG